MKFLLTGGLRNSSGPRQVLTFALLFLLLFVIAHGIREAHTTGTFPSEIEANIRGSADLPASRSALLLLEDLHVDLVLFSMAILFLGSLLIQSKMSFAQKKWTLGILCVTLLVYLVSRPLTAYVGSLALVVSVSGILLHVILFLLILFLIADLYRKVGNA